MTTKEIAISETYNREQGKLKGFVRKQLDNNEDAEDIVQEVFMTLTDGFDDILNFTGVVNWLYAVAKNKIIDFKRKKKPSRLDDQKSGETENDEVLHLSDILPSFENLPDDKMMQDLIWDQINLSLDKLPETQKQVFLLHELEGYSFNQISEVTGLGINTLLSRKRYAIIFLREELKNLFEIVKQ